jgi:hypothetical protein
MSKLVWECQQAICALSNTNKVTCLWVPGHSGIQGNQDEDTLAMKGSSNLLLGSEPAIPISPCVGSLKIKEWITKKHSKYTAVKLARRRSKLFTERPSEKLSKTV